MEKQTFTLAEVYAALVSMPFTKFIHRSFTDEEYIYGDSFGMVRDENGYCLPKDEFFALRKESMADGWYIKEDNKPDETKVESKPNMSEKEIQELYEKAKEIIKSQPNNEINVSEFNNVFDMFNDGNPQRVDKIRLIKNKLDFIHLCKVSGYSQPWEAHMKHLSVEIRRNILKQIVEKYTNKIKQL